MQNDSVTIVQVPGSVQALESVQVSESVQTLESVQVSGSVQVSESVQALESVQVLESVQALESVQGVDNSIKDKERILGALRDNNVIFISAQPDNTYFHWQVEIYLYQFAKQGVADRCFALIGYTGSA